MRHFDPILLEGREWPPAEFEVTPELVKEIPRQVADLYGKMSELVDNDDLGLLEITRRVAELYESHENGNFETEALLAGNFPPLLLGYFASLNGWTEFMGLVLMSGFCPCALAGLSPSALLRGTSGRYTKKWELPGHPPADWILEQVSCDEDPGLLRLDGLTLSRRTLIEIYLHILERPDGGIPKQPHWGINTAQEKWIEYRDADIHGQLLQQLRRGINLLLPRWIEYRDANGWKVPKGKNVLRLQPRKFVRFAKEIKFDIPWLGFAETHFPHLLPEKLTGRPTSATNTAISADAYHALKTERDELEQRLENTNRELEKLRSEKGAIEKSMVDKTGIPGKRAESTYQNIIAALLDCIAGNLPNIEKHPSFPSEAKLIEAIGDHFQGYSGLSKSNLSRKFPEAKRALQFR